ncbi:hypothetical protein BIV57_12500 [Mangrovactinospora gilvigrisea]|uniref:histidine kinase n=1 Tax=Mangrovactinospora gilvigrisea TaxID=1428644 RepID=A0A1J7C6F5_9ACTN|nr:histidine kinase [Mangrovactinospora gilvigrisea]OIV37144.1 hypothetical protein BIV57_12500 [Mangrovactinospora gilvigrisea]
MASTSLPVPRRFVRTAVRSLFLAALALLWVLDAVSSLVIHRPEQHGFAPQLLSGAAVAVLLTAERLGPLRLRALLAVLVSGACTLLMLASQVGAAPLGFPEPLSADGPNPLSAVIDWRGSPGVLELVVLVLTVHLVAHRVAPARTALLLSIALLLVTAALPLRRFGPSVGGLAFSFLCGVVALAAAGFGAYLRIVEERRNSLMERARHAERLELARDLHDFVAHHITGIVVQAQAARTVGATAPERVGPILDTIEQAGLETLDSMRRLVTVLRTPRPDATAAGASPDAPEAIAAAVEAFRRSGTGPRVDLEITSAARAAPLSPEAAGAAHRVVVEALTNVRRHAPGTAGARVDVTTGPQGLLVEVRNAAAPGAAGPRRSAAALRDGRGGYGLVGLRERVEAAGGALDAGPLPDGSWQVSARLPLRSRAVPGGAAGGARLEP